MRRRWLPFGIHLLACTAFTWGRLPAVPGIEEPERPQHVHRHDCRVNFSIKGGFTSSLLSVPDSVLNSTVINEVRNNHKIGHLGPFFMRINFRRHFLQPEFSYTINRCSITFEKPLPDDAFESSTPEVASITPSIHNFEISVIYGYNIIKEGPYSLAVLGGPKIRYIWDKKSKVTFENFDQRDIGEELYPLNVSLTAGVAVTIPRIFFDFRYDIRLHNISKRISHKPIYDESAGEETTLANQICLHKRDNVLSSSFGVFF